MTRIRPAGGKGFSLIELLCVMAIIGILAGLMMPGLGKALRKARGLGSHLGSLEGIEMRIGEVNANYVQYRSVHPNHGRLSRRAFIHDLQLSPQAEEWLTLNSVEYRPFAAADPTNQVAIVVYPSPGSGSGDHTVIFTIADLMRQP